MAEAATDISKDAKMMDLYSRQIGAYGLETMSKLVNMKVAIVGLKGVGVEAAKNLILAGPGQVTLCDDEPAEIKDLGANFYLTPADVGVPRAKACAERLQELNGLVRVKTHSGALTEAMVSEHDMLVMTAGLNSELLRWNQFCRDAAKPIKFIAAGAMGTLAFVFSDFGKSFTVSDETGEQVVTRTVTDISCDKEGVVSLVDPNISELAQQHGIDDNDHRGWVTFSEVKGMTCGGEESINTQKPFRIKHVEKRVVDYLKLPANKGGDGTIQQEQYWVYAKDKKTGERIKDADPRGGEPGDGFKWTPLFPCDCSDIPEEDFVREADGKKKMRMKLVMDHYKLEIGDTTKFSKYEGGGVLTQVLTPTVHSHRSFAECLKEPLGEGERTLMISDGDKGQDKSWWYPMLHVAMQALLEFQTKNSRLPAPNNLAEAEEVANIARSANCNKDLLDLSGEVNAPLDKSTLKAEQLEALQALKEMGMDEARALIALAANGWSAEEAAMWGMMDETAQEKMDSGAKSIERYLALEAIKLIARTAAAELQPMGCFIGGVVAQEVVKHCGKFMPLKQWFHFDAVEVLPKDPPADSAPQNSRYDNLTMMFGGAIQKKLQTSKTFMVGCGALGCEYLKNFALLGVATAEGGLITVTDGDRIEVSNLNRQFLFRAHHVGTPKSITAAEMVKAMNPDIKVDSLELLAMASTENVFNDGFWIGSGVANRSGEPKPFAAGAGIDWVTNALDSVPARKYVDSRCVFFKKPLLESGTEGTKFNSMVVLPGQTETYDEGDPEPPAGEAIPMCTLRNFPSTMVHCIEWARSQFEDLFVSPIKELEKYMEDPGYVQKIKDEVAAFMMDANDISKASDALLDQEGNGLLKNARDAAEAKKDGFDACVRQAMRLFADRYNHKMRDLINQYPEDALTKDGKKFWSPPKRFPTALEFALDNETIVDFIMAAANLLAVSYGLAKLPENGRNDDGTEFDTFIPADSPWRKLETLKAAVVGHPMPEWVASSAKIKAEEDEDDGAPAAATESLEDSTAKLMKKLDELSSIDLSGVKAQPADFEKDLDPNFHIDFVAASANLRARNYGIAEDTRHKVKMIAGKIIPAIATSTACATALMCLELLKILQEKPKADFKNSSNNFAINLFQMSEPHPSRTFKGVVEEEILPNPLTDFHAFDDKGVPKPECIKIKRKVYYPDPHTKWERLYMPAGTTLAGMIQEFKDKHAIVLRGWTVEVIGENGKPAGAVLYTKPVEVDTELLFKVAPLDIEGGFNKATMAIMRCTEIKNKQLYTNQWKELQPAKVEQQKAFLGQTLRKILEDKVGVSLEGCKSVKLDVIFEVASGDEAITPMVVLEI